MCYKGAENRRFIILLNRKSMDVYPVEKWNYNNNVFPTLSRVQTLQTFHLKRPVKKKKIITKNFKHFEHR